ncbi:hypothetical protein FRC10_008296 [Ceratobasidium sp. 414]|nr:hypothetical protein FRC10_008296 [Ceratobasidium sp. 414]
MSDTQDNAPKVVYRIGSRLRLSPSQSTELSYLRLLAGSAKEELRRIGREAFGAAQENPEDAVVLGNNPTTFMILFDNIQRYVIPRHETVGNKTKMKTGTVATLVVLEDIPAGAFARSAYTAKSLLSERQNLTLDELCAAVDYGHLERVGTATIMRILVNNVRELGHFRKGNLFKDSNYCAKNPLATRKSCIYPMATSGINEGTASGASEVLDDLIGQLDIPPKQFDDLLCLVGGDQMSVNRMRQAGRSLEQEATIYAQKD